MCVYIYIYIHIYIYIYISPPTPEEEMAVHSSFLAWKIPWIEETGELELQRGVAKSQTRLSN